MLKKKEDRKTERVENLLDGKGTTTFNHFFSKAEFKAKVKLCTEVIIPAGGSIGNHQHLDEDEIYIISAGEGLLGDGTIVKPGDSILTKHGESHAIENHGIHDLVFLAIIVCY